MRAGTGIVVAAGPRRRGRSHRATRAGILVVVVGAAVLVSSAAARQDPPPADPSTEPVPLEAGGEGVEPADAGAATSTTLAVVPPAGATDQDAALTESERANRTIQYVVLALVVLALLVATVSVVFWRRTKPTRVMAAEASRVAAAATGSGSTRPLAPAVPAAGGQWASQDWADERGDPNPNQERA